MVIKLREKDELCKEKVLSPILFHVSSKITISTHPHIQEIKIANWYSVVLTLNQSHQMPTNLLKNIYSQVPI
jgi:hypothetical protein